MDYIDILEFILILAIIVYLFFYKKSIKKRKIDYIDGYLVLSNNPNEKIKEGDCIIGIDRIRDTFIVAEINKGNKEYYIQNGKQKLEK